jgi:hypothetical protein
MPLLGLFRMMTERFRTTHPTDALGTRGRPEPRKATDTDGHEPFRIHSAFEPPERSTHISKIVISRRSAGVVSFTAVKPFVRLQTLPFAGTFRADGRTRTGDPFITSEVLYQLSYVGGAGRG